MSSCAPRRRRSCSVTVAREDLARDADAPARPGRGSDARPDASGLGAPPAAEWGGLATAEWARRFGYATAEFHARVPSTNERARALALAGRPLPVLVVASRQSAGRGRRGRRWASDSPLGLWFTVAVAGGRGPTEPVPLRAGLAAALAVESLAPGLAVRLKWPNDLLAGPEGRKFGGVLCERAGGATIVGIGLDLNHGPGDLPAHLAGRATSVRAETGRRLARGDVLRTVLAALAVRLRPEPSIPPGELAELNARSFMAGRRASASGVASTPSGEARAVEALPVVCGPILADGALQLRSRDGGTLRLVAGSVTPAPSSARPGPPPGRASAAP